MAPYRQTSAERSALLNQSAELLDRAHALELSLLRASSPNMPTNAPSNGPPPPQLVYRTTSAICVRPRNYTPTKGGTAETTAVFAKVSAAGISVSTNNSEYVGSNERVALQLPQAQGE